MNLRFGFRILLPVLALAMTAMVACGQGSNETPAPQGLLPTVSPVEPARPLTAQERAAIEEFDDQQQAIAGERDQFYQEFDQWRADIIACHPDAAREALREFAASFSAITQSARSLPRTSSTRELAGMLIAAANADEAAFRQLRDRWQPGNVSLLEAVERNRVEAGNAQSAVTDLSLELQEEFEEGPSASEMQMMEEFSDTFDEIADAWDDFHDEYAAFAKRERRLKDGEIVAGYERLAGQFKEIVATINGLTPAEINEDLIETLQDVAEAELAALEYLLDTLAQPSGSATGTIRFTATTVSLPAQSPEPPSGPAVEPSQEAQPTPTEPAPAEPAPTMEPSAPPSPAEELAAAIEESEEALLDVEEAIEEIVNDKSAEYLEDLHGFDVEFEGFVDEWSRFHAGFAEWRATDGGCDRVGVTLGLGGLSRQVGDLARQVRGLPQAGFLLPVYTLMVEAAEREAIAFRTLANSWTPFSVDAFRAVDEERVGADRLRQQASIALEELRSRP